MKVYSSLIDLSDLWWWDSGEATSLSHWTNAQHLHHDQEMCREFGQSSCLSLTRGHFPTAHW